MRPHRMRGGIFFPLFQVLLLAALPLFGGGAKEEVQVQGGPSPVPAHDRPFTFTRTVEFTGVAGRLTSREASVEAALRDAARRLSLFHSVSAGIKRWEYLGGGSLDHAVELEYHLEYDDELSKFLDALDFDPERDVFENNNAVFVRARAASPVSMPSSWGHSSGGDRPFWADAPPQEIGGFTAGVGFAARRSSHKDTVIASYENAVIEIIESMFSAVSSRQVDAQNSYSAFGNETSAETTITAQGILTNFYIIESWTDPSNLAVWTLAVAAGR